MQMTITYVLLVITGVFSVVSIMNFRKKGQLTGRTAIRTIAAVVVFFLCIVSVIKGVSIFELQATIEGIM
ncbi:MAG: hypothetical protein KGV57_04755 [Fusobacterium sp.]|nr:hypothetical protein [Fusobacterium sp.]